MSNNHYIKKTKDGRNQETINFIQSVMGDKFQYGCWFNILKYPIRAYDKHDTPLDDIKKTMHYCLFMINDLSGKEATYNQDKFFELFDYDDDDVNYFADYFSSMDLVDMLNNISITDVKQEIKKDIKE